MHIEMPVHAGTGWLLCMPNMSELQLCLDAGLCSDTSQLTKDIRGTM